MKLVEGWAIAAAAALVLLSACGGGGGEDPVRLFEVRWQGED